MTEISSTAKSAAEDIGRVAKEREIAVATAESLTSGVIASALGAAPAASEWFCGGVIAYSSTVKFDVLGVTPGPVVSAHCAAQMVEGVIRLTGAGAAVSVTGVGGPGPQEGQPAGTVFVATCAAGSTTVTEHHFDTTPQRVIEHTVDVALQQLRAAITLQSMSWS